MAIYRINQNDSNENKFALLNEMILEVAGKVAQGKFDKNELDNLYTQLAESGFGLDRKFLREVGLGNTSGTYGNWSHVQTETGYGIWKIAVSNYAHNAVNNIYLDDAVLENRGQASSETLVAFDIVKKEDGESGGGFTDNSAEAATEGGTEFNLMDSTDDYLYVGHSTTFDGVKFEFETRGGNYNVYAEYYNGASWELLDATGEEYDDGTLDFARDGLIAWTVPGDWATTSVDGDSKYWVRFSTDSTPSTTAKAYLIIPADSVIGLLALSSEEVSKKEWAWCYYSGSVYVTIKNAGNSNYEGDLFITSGSSSTNKENYFVHNHQYKADYEDSSYSGV